MIKKIFKKTIIGIAMGCTILNLLLLIFKLTGSTQAFALVTNDYIRQSACSMLVSIVFNVLAIIYDYDHISHSLQTLFHMGIGLTIYFIVAYYAHWIPLNNGFSVMVSSIIFMLVVSFGIWFGFYLYHKSEARKINNKISNLH